ncbi:glycosyltransferase [Oscillatoria sp. CS-180]|uniref:glycosyltransferase n=1 Tax=Oscillatoria sp. CS-180 TaxID=3021720 RepID=UPI00232ADE09|nr:glycosyltransferase [Oscillatoria sp. CS-180]MDB9528170.1 glycosyltransferase [Oscillatoria sp. CS-180]
MSRIVLTTWGSLGDLHPILALGLGLRDPRHTVAIATTTDYQTTVESLGLAFHPIRPDLPDDPQIVEQSMDPKTGPEVVLKDFVLGNIRDTYEDLRAIAQDADLMIAHEIVYAAPIVAETLKLPWVSCALAPAAFFSAYEPIVTSSYPALAKLHDFGPGINRWAVRLAKLATRSWGKPLYALRQELGLPPIQNPIVGHDKYSPRLVLALFSSVLGTPKPDWPPNVVTTGFAFYDGHREQPMTPELEDFLSSGEPPLVFTLGSAAVKVAADFYTESAQAAIQLKRRAVLLMGKNALPQHLPSNIFACEYAPYSKIFPRASAIVHQGGVGTTAQALRAGRPTLIVPYSFDQPDNAARMQRLGTSRTLPRDSYSASRVARELSNLIETPSYAVKAAEIGQVIQSEDGVRVACEALIENFQI